MPNGIVILKKEAGMTSHTAVARLRRLFGGEKAGHTGTLDPMATGVLPVMLGRAVKASEYMTESDKHYIATLRLGLTTDTEDITGQVLTRCDTLPTPEEVETVAARFVGDIEQTPPMYSAVKVGGKRLMELARQGQTVAREPRRITVLCLKIRRLSDTDYGLDVVCSKGTYIRTLCADIGAALGCGGVMAALCRVCAAGFDLSAAHTLTELEEMTEEERAAQIIPTERLFAHCPRVDMPAFYARLLHNGQTVLQKKLRVSHTPGTRLRLYGEQGFFALGEAVSTEEGDAVRPLKLFVL